MLRLLKQNESTGLTFTTTLQNELKVCRWHVKDKHVPEEKKRTDDNLKQMLFQLVFKIYISKKQST